MGYPLSENSDPQDILFAFTIRRERMHKLAGKSELFENLVMSDIHLHSIEIQMLFIRIIRCIVYIRNTEIVLYAKRPQRIHWNETQGLRSKLWRYPSSE